MTLFYLKILKRMAMPVDPSSLVHSRKWGFSKPRFPYLNQTKLRNQHTTKSAGVTQLTVKQRQSLKKLYAFSWLFAGLVLCHHTLGTARRINHFSPILSVSNKNWRIHHRFLSKCKFIRTPWGPLHMNICSHLDTPISQISGSPKKQKTFNRPLWRWISCRTCIIQSNSLRSTNFL